MTGPALNDDLRGMLWAGKIEVDVSSLRFFVLGREELIKKKATGRDKDAVDVRALEALGK